MCLLKPDSIGAVLMPHQADVSQKERGSLVSTGLGIRNPSLGTLLCRHLEPQVSANWASVSPYVIKGVQWTK